MIRMKKMGSHSKRTIIFLREPTEQTDLVFETLLSYSESLGSELLRNSIFK
jgi:hypothetical protein